VAGLFSLSGGIVRRFREIRSSFQPLPRDGRGRVTPLVLKQFGFLPQWQPGWLHLWVVFFPRIQRGRRFLTAWSGFDSPADSLHQIRGGDAQSFGNQNDVLDAGIADAALDVAEISAVKVGLFGEGFLGKSFGSPMLRYALAKRAKDGITLSHDAYFTPLSEMSLSVISDNFVFAYLARFAV
jgi:hypothetical protein